MTTRRRLIGVASGTALGLVMIQAGFSVRAQTVISSDGSDGGDGGGSGTTETLSVTIATTAPPLNISPAGYFFEANVTGADVSTGHSPNWDPSFHEVQYSWSIPTDSGPYDAPQHLVAEHNDKGKGSGKFISKVFETPGVHKVRVFAYDRAGNWGTAEIDVTVADPEAHFTAFNTIVVATDGDFTGAPAHITTNAVTSLGAAHARYNAIHSAHDLVRILLKRGQTFVTDGNPYAFAWTSQYRHAGLYFSAFGSGAKPIVDASPGMDRFLSTGYMQDYRASKAHFLIDNLDFRGTWDPLTERWAGGKRTTYVLFGYQAFNAYFVFNRLDVKGFGSFTSFEGQADGPGEHTTAFFNECSHTDNKDFACLGFGDLDIGVTGGRYVQNLQALNGGMNRSLLNNATNGVEPYPRNSHGGFRISAKRMYIAGNDFFHRHGWTQQNNILYDNALLRLNAKSLPDRYCIVTGNNLETQISSESSDGVPTQTLPINMLIERNMMMQNPSLPTMIQFCWPGVTIRDNMLISPNIPVLPDTGGFGGQLIQMYHSGATKTAEKDSVPIRIYNNTIVNLRSTANNRTHNPTIWDYGGFGGLVAENNVLFQPNLDAPAIADGPFDKVSPGYEARYLGYRRGYDLGVHPLAAPVPPGGSVTVPYPKDFAGTQTTQADYAAQGPLHGVKIGAAWYAQPKGECSLTFAAAAITVKNTGTATWPAGTIEVMSDRGTRPMPMWSIAAIPSGAMRVYRPQAGAGVVGAATTGLVSLFDFYGTPRRGSKHPDAAAGAPSRGAVEPA